MRRLIPIVLALATLSLATSGCGVGYNRLFFMTLTNVGLDVDTKPPTAEVSVARREVIIEPSFEEGKTLPVAASFRKEGGFFDPKISAMFSGGKAAVLVSKLFDSRSTTPPKRLKSKLCLKERPEGSRVLSFWSKIPVLGSLTEEGDEERPFFFATDTTYGLKVAWSGTTEAVPDTLRLGYNRKEFAYAPVFGTNVTGAPPPPPAGEEPEDQPCEAGEYEIQAASFIASIDNSTKIAEITKSDLKYVQFFATGEAANNLALQPELRGVLVSQLAPQVSEAAKRRETNRELIDDINNSFDAGDATKKSTIINKAVELKLVDSGTTAADFKGRLARNEAGGSEVSAKLEQLKAVAS
jgi:hypothetical protein